MNRFNLTFWGEILPGKDPEQVKAGLASILGIEDPAELERCFSGSRVILRHNLERKSAAEFYSKLHQLGAFVKLDKVSDRDLAQTEPKPPPPPPPKPAASPGQTGKAATAKPKPNSPDPRRSQSDDFLRRELGLVQRSSSHGPGPGDNGSTGDKAAAAAPAAGPDSVAEQRAERAREKQLADEEAARLRAKEHALKHALRAREGNGAPLHAKEQALSRALTSRNAARDALTEPAGGQPGAAENARLQAAEAEARRKAELERKARQERTAAAEAAQREAAAAGAQAQRKAEQEREAAADAALREAEAAEARRNADEAEARRKADEAEAKRRAEEAEAKRKAEEAEAKRRAEEAEAKRKAQRERKAAEAARRKAEQEESRRKKAEAAARRKAARAEAKRQQAEEAARARAERERQQAEEAARRQAELEEARRLRTEEEARQAAQLEEQRRKEAELKTRLAAEHEETLRLQRAQEAEKQRLAAEEAAARARLQEQEKQQAAERAAAQKAEDTERKRQQAEAAAARARLKGQEKQQAAKRAAAQKAGDTERKRQQAEAAAARARLKEQEKQQAAKRATARKAEAAERKRQQGEEAARRRAEEQRLRDEEHARIKAAEAEQSAQRLAMEEQTIQRAAAELAQKPSLQGAAATSAAGTAAAAAPRPAVEGRRKRQPGEANLYSLRPFRNTPEVQARVEHSLRRMRLGLGVAVVAVAALVLLGVGLLTRPAVPLPAGPDAIAIDAQGKPLLLAGDRVFLLDRSGSELNNLALAALGLATLQPPLAFDSTGNLFGLGTLAGDDQGSAAGATPQLLRCQLAQPGCQVFAPALDPFTVSSFVIHPLDDTVFVADAASGQLLKVSAGGAIVARAVANLPPRPVLLPDSGLLLVNSAEGPAISVFRYEDSAFGQQLDEILLLVPVNGGPDQLRVGDFVRSADSWWITLVDTAAGRADLYRFDSQWNFIDQVELAPDTRPAQLASWSRKTLVLDPQQLPVQRFSAEGAPEAALVSSQLEEMIADGRSKASITALLWRSALALCALAAVIGCCVAWLQRVRKLVYTTCRSRGAEPIDGLADSIQWVDPHPARAVTLRRVSIAYGLLSLALVLVAVGLSVSALQLSALLLALAGPATALALLYRSPSGHIGLVQQQLLLVDHTGMYHLGAGGRIHYRGHFLIIDDVAVFTGARLLPAFSPGQIEEQVMPLARDGIKVDRSIVLVKLLQSRHPLAIGAVVTAATVMAAITGLFFQGIF